MKIAQKPEEDDKEQIESVTDSNHKQKGGAGTITSLSESNLSEKAQFKLKASNDVRTMSIKPDAVQDVEDIFRQFKDVETEEVSQMSLLRENYKKSKQQDKD